MNAHHSTMLGDSLKLPQSLPVLTQTASFLEMELHSSPRNIQSRHGTIERSKITLSHKTDQSRVFGVLPKEWDETTSLKSIDVKKLYAVTERFLQEKALLESFTNSDYDDETVFPIQDRLADSVSVDPLHVVSRVSFLKASTIDLKTTTSQRPQTAKSRLTNKTQNSSFADAFGDTATSAKYMHRRFMESFSQCITVGPKSELPPSAETVATPNDSKYSGSICNASQERHVQRIRSAPSKMQSPQTLLKTQSQKLQKIETREINSGSIHYVDLREKSRPASANESKEGEICRQGKSVKNQQRPRMEKVEPFATSWIKQYMSDMIEKDEIIEAAVETAAAGQNFRRLSAVERTSVVYRLRSNLSDRQAKGQNIIRIEPAMLALKKQGYERTKEEVQLIFQIARSLPAFHNLNDLYLIQICKVLKHARFMKDEIIFNQGDEGKEWYIILYGSVSIHISSTGDPKDNRFIRTMGYGQGFGDIALINRCHRTATVKSNQTTDVLIVEKFEFDRMLKGIYINEVNTIELFLRKVPIFNEREVQSLRAIAQQMARRSYQPKQAIYVEGEDLDTIYFLKTGVVSVVSSYRPSNSHRKEYLVLGVIHPLQYFGQEGFQRNPKFKSVSAHTTMIAGDATKMTQDEIGISITLRSLYKTNRDFHDAAISKNPLTSNHGAKPLSHIENNSVEVVEIEYAHAMEIINELPWMPWNYTTRQDLAKLKHSDTRWRKWEKLKEHEMNMLVKEKFGDPNMTIQQARKTRKNARTHKSSKPKPKD